LVERGGGIIARETFRSCTLPLFRFASVIPRNGDGPFFAPMTRESGEKLPVPLIIGRLKIELAIVRRYARLCAYLLHKKARGRAAEQADESDPRDSAIGASDERRAIAIISVRA